MAISAYKTKFCSAPLVFIIVGICMPCMLLLSRTNHSEETVIQHVQSPDKSFYINMDSVKVRLSYIHVLCKFKVQLYVQNRSVEKKEEDQLSLFSTQNIEFIRFCKLTNRIDPKRSNNYCHIEKKCCHLIIDKYYH